MSQLILLTVFTRNGKTPASSTAAFDVDDIVSPIRFNATTGKSYFRARMMSGVVRAGKSETNAVADYVVNNTLASIIAQSEIFVSLTVTKSGTPTSAALTTPETQLFNTRRMGESIVPRPVTLDGAAFYYHEDGNPLAVYYEVSNSVASIVAGTVPVSPDIYDAITYAQGLALMAAGTVTPGRHYLITDRGDNGIFLHGVTTTNFSREGIRLMSVPKYYAPGPQSIDTYIGVWAPNKAVNIGEVAIWGGLAWTNLTGAIGNATNNYTLDAGNWMPNAKPSASYYEVKQFGVSFDYENDWIERQWDGQGNIFGIDFADEAFEFMYGFNVCDVADWNMEANGSSFIFRNNNCIGAFNNAVSVYGNSNTGAIFYNRPLSMGTLEIKFNSNKGDINNNENAGNISYNTDKILAISNLTNVDGNMTKDELCTPGSTYYVIDITGSALFTVPSYLVRSIQLTSGNATESITSITGMPLNIDRESVRIEPASGLAVTFVHGTGPDEPRCEGGISAVIDGTTGDWIELDSPAANVVRQKNIGTY